MQLLNCLFEVKWNIKVALLFLWGCPFSCPFHVFDGAQIWHISFPYCLRWGPMTNIWWTWLQFPSGNVLDFTLLLKMKFGTIQFAFCLPVRKGVPSALAFNYLTCDIHMLIELICRQPFWQTSLACWYLFIEYRCCQIICYLGCLFIVNCFQPYHVTVGAGDVAFKYYLNKLI